MTDFREDGAFLTSPPIREQPRKRPTLNKVNGKKLIIIIEPKPTHSDLPKDVANNLKHKTDFIIKNNAFLAEHRIENKIRQLLSKYMHKDNIPDDRKQLNELQICP